MARRGRGEERYLGLSFYRACGRVSFSSFPTFI
jgi:hypothetical protein